MSTQKTDSLYSSKKAPPNMNEKTGRTFWDWVSGNPKLFIFLVIIGLGVIGYIIHNFKIIFPSGFSIERQTDSRIVEKEEKPVPTVTNQENPLKSASKTTKPQNLSVAEPKAIIKIDSIEGDFKGRVVDKNSNVLKGIEVLYEDQKVVTKSDGSFILRVPVALTKGGRQIELVLSQNGHSYAPYHNPNGSTLVFPPN